jgi:hypothetical protein
MKKPNLNLLNKTRCYCIGSMENDPHGDDWRAVVTGRLKWLGITVFDPYHKPFLNEIKEDKTARKMLKRWMKDGEYHKVHKRMKHVRSDDLRLCDISDFFIVRIDPKVGSWGSAEELVTANRAKKPIFLVIEGGRKVAPLWLMGMLPSHYFYDTLEDALTMIERIDSGKKRIDSDRWRLLREEYR